MKRLFRKITAWFLLVSFLFAIAPREFIHSFANHEDTCDHSYDGRQLSTQHIHCESLQLSLPAFKDAEQFSLPSSVSMLMPQLEQVPVFSGYFFSYSPVGRAPPVCA